MRGGGRERGGGGGEHKIRERKEEQGIVDSRRAVMIPAGAN